MIREVATTTELIDAALDILGGVLPARWRAERQTGPTGDEDPRIAVFDANGSSTSMLVEAALLATPAALEGSINSPLARRFRRSGNTTLLVVAPYLSPRSRQLLDREEVNYLDLTGNVRLSTEHPAAFVRTVGAQRDPRPRARPDRGIAGAAAGQVVRALADVAPPYNATQVAAVASVSVGYCSRVLAVLADEALIVRARRGVVIEVQWAELLRRRAHATRTLFDPDRTTSFIARNGATNALEDIATVSGSFAITGSFAAARLAPVTAPRGLVLYTDSPDELASKLSLLPSDEGADVRLIVPASPGVYDRVEAAANGLRWVAPSQIVIDCLAGTGRMPEEADAVLAWMIDNEATWRAASIDLAVPRPNVDD